MAKIIKTKEELSANIEKARTDIRQGENLIKQLRNKASHELRKQRKRRLIERSAIAKSLVPGADGLSNEQFKALLSTGLNTDAANKMLAFFKKSNSTAETGAMAGAEPS